VRKLGWVSVAWVFASLFLAAVETSNEFNALLDSWYRYLWILPFSFTISSIFLLLVSLIISSIVPTCVPRRLLSGAYLMNGPSIALLSASTSLGIATPAWVNYVTPALMLTSAWAYYRSLTPLEEDGVSGSKERHQTEDTTWVNRIGAWSARGVQHLD